VDLNATRMFVTVVRAGSLSSAAAQSRVPLPTLSRRIRDLERELKVQLFERSTRGVRLTEAGTRLYDYAVRGIDVLSDGEQAVRQAQAQLKGRLRLSAPPAFAPWWDLLAAFQRLYPDIEIAVYSTERRVDLIQDGVDVALRLNDVADETLVARKIATYRHVLVAAPALIAAHGRPDAPGDLQHYPLGVWTPGGQARPRWRLGDEDFEPHPVLSTNDYQHLAHAATAGVLATELPPFLAAPAVLDGRLVPLLPDRPLPVQTASLVYHSHRYLSTLVRAYLDFCAEAAPKILYEARRTGAKAS